jgi:hypothetical protein
MIHFIDSIVQINNIMRSYLDVILSKPNKKVEKQIIGKSKPELHEEKYEEKQNFRQKFRQNFQQKYMHCYSQKSAILYSCTECLKKFLDRDGIDYNIDIGYNGWGDEMVTDTCSFAITKNNFVVCKWLFDNGYFKKYMPPEQVTELYKKYNSVQLPWYRVCNTALEQNVDPPIFELLKSLYDKEYPELNNKPPNHYGSWNTLFHNVKLDLVKHLYTKYGIQISIYDAITEGRLDILQFAHENKFPYDKEKCIEELNKKLEYITKQIESTKDPWRAIGLEYGTYQYPIKDALSGPILEYINSNM